MERKGGGREEREVDRGVSREEVPTLMKWGCALLYSAHG